MGSQMKENAESMGQRGSEGHKLWLFDLAHGNLNDCQILQGFLKYYVL